MKELVLTLFACTGLLSGCANEAGTVIGLTSATATVIATLKDDLFTGTAVGYMDRTGTIDVASTIDPALRCVGQFRYTGTKVGTGELKCNDGRSAAFQFIGLTALSGYGYGSSERGGMSFTFGLTPANAAQYLKLPQGKVLKNDAKGRAQSLTDA